MNSQTILMSQTLQRCRCLDLGFTVAVVEALAFGGQDMFDGLTRQTDCLALLKVSGSGLLFSTASCLCCSRGLSIGVITRMARFWPRQDGWVETNVCFQKHSGYVGMVQCFWLSWLAGHSVKPSLHHRINTLGLMCSQLLVIKAHVA